ncbi:hypothetical protein RNJ44_05084 [Nakaseomyces bracarensis]|uniref:Uncharacterized protein n=1 Tax=Nakaseomyces bracarensis TaxID=273131 RepID=A0ABR4NWU3_9SACH
MSKFQAPTLVGGSVRNMRDDGSETPRSDSMDSNVLNRLHDTVSHSHQLQRLKDDSYTSVDDLNKEGALLTDEVDLELNHVDEKVQREDGEVDFHLVDRKLSENELEKQRRRKLMLLKQKQKTREHSVSTSTSRTRGVASSSSQVSLTNLDDETREELDRVSRSQERVRPASSSAISPVRGIASNIPGAIGNINNTADGRVRNSYGEFIKSTCNRPHLARGDSYQNSSDELLDPSAAGGATSDAAAGNGERPGRSSFRRRLSTEYLRSLSRSLSRDPNAHGQGQGHAPANAQRSKSKPPTGGSQVIGKGEYIDSVSSDRGSLSCTRFDIPRDGDEDDALHIDTSTNNYPISQAELAQATLEEFDEEEEGALLDDQGNEEHSRDLEQAAIKEES